jgi:phenylpropionate dioxygenase-like ring-hydroxylating dioxygenase large terminal subunit
VETYLRNVWYIAGWADEVTADVSVSRRIVDVPILLLRDAAGTARAIGDTCPHRFAPLHLGKFANGIVECPYHGLQFDGSGQCVRNPHGDGRIPSSAKVASYPLVERFSLLWIWMGDVGRANADSIPDFSVLVDDKHVTFHGYIHSRANYQLMTDNILDLGHVDFLHQGSLGNEAIRRASREIEQHGLTVKCNLLAPNDFAPPFFVVKLPQFADVRVDHWLDVRWDPPATMLLRAGITPTGQPRSEGGETPSLHGMTPETEFTTHYFWAQARDFRLDDAQLTEQLRNGLRFAFEEQDMPMIAEAQQRMETSDLWSLKPVMLAGDAGAIRARRVLQQVINDERQLEASGA